MDTLDVLQEIIEYKFKNKYLLKNALMHSSYTNEKKMAYISNYERLEYLGDAVLELVSSRFIYDNYPGYKEGEMTKLRASLVCEYSLANVARKLEIGKFILLGKGERKSKGADRSSILCDVVEAIIGAMYLDGGISSAESFIMRHVLSDIDKKQLFQDSKSTLQELVKKLGYDSVKYELLSETGPENDKQFEFMCMIDGKAFCSGIGRSKKLAQQEAAYKTLINLQKTE
ncbi:MAG: ribonuclease III [Eubacterium sp.]|nr:ribonuclease III [Eubacterium sp.]